MGEERQIGMLEYEELVRQENIGYAKRSSYIGTVSRMTLRL